MLFVPALRELPDALRLSGLQVSAGGGREIQPTHPMSPAIAVAGGRQEGSPGFYS